MMATEALPVIPKTQKATTPSLISFIQCGRFGVVVHFQNFEREEEDEEENSLAALVLDRFNAASVAQICADFIDARNIMTLKAKHVLRVRASGGRTNSIEGQGERWGRILKGEGNSSTAERQ